VRGSLAALAVSTFAIGTTEFVVVGLLPEIGADLGVSITSAGLLVSLYALAITLGTPIFTALTGSLARRPLVIGLMILFSLTNLISAFAPDYATLLGARIVMAVAHGVFFGVGAAVASHLVPREKSARAVATMMGGLTLAMVIGVPLGSWIGQTFDWRTPFLVVAALGAVATVSLVMLLPKKIEHEPTKGFRSQLSILGKPVLLQLWAFTALGWGATFTVFSFIAPLMTDVTHVSESTVNLALVLFGAASVAGNSLGGRLADRWGGQRAMVVMLTGVLVSMALIPLTMHSLVALLINMAVWGGFAFSLPPIMQSSVVLEARRISPQAVHTASGLNIAAFNLGISLGSFVGGRVIVASGVDATPWGGVVMAIAAFGVLLLIRRTARRAGTPAHLAGTDRVVNQH
jgi:multidrug resistance protein